VQEAQLKIIEFCVNDANFLYKILAEYTTNIRLSEPDSKKKISNSEYLPNIRSIRSYYCYTVIAHTYMKISTRNY